MNDTHDARPSVLFADDEPTIRAYYAKIFLSNGYETVYEAQDGEEAWHLYQRYKPDILILDIDMPKLDGLMLAKRIRMNDMQSRIIIATAHVDNEKLLLAVELHLTKYLPKPFSPDMLSEAVEKARSEHGRLNLILLGEGYKWNRLTKSLLHNDQFVRLTRQERRLMELLSANLTQIHSTDAIMGRLWDIDLDSDFTNDKLKTLIRRLRKKLPDNAIENIYGVGYRLNIAQ